MIDCFGYLDGCSICGGDVISSRTAIVKGELVCSVCYKAVRDATEQQIYLKKLYSNESKSR